MVEEHKTAEHCVVYVSVGCRSCTFDLNLRRGQVEISKATLGRKAVKNTSHGWLHVADTINDHGASNSNVHIPLLLVVFVSAFDMSSIRAVAHSPRLCIY